MTDSDNGTDDAEQQAQSELASPRSAFTCSAVALIIAFIPGILGLFPSLFRCYGSCGGLGFVGAFLLFIFTPFILFIIAVVMFGVGISRREKALRESGVESERSPDLNW